MTEIVCIYQKEHVSFFTSKATDGYEQFNYRGSNTIPHRVFEEDTHDIAEYLVKKLRSCTGLSFVFDARTDGTDKLAELLADKYDKKANFYDLNRLKVHLEKIEVLAWLSVQKGEMERLQNEITALKSEKLKVENAKEENSTLKTELISAQERTKKLGNELEEIRLNKIRRIVRGNDLYSDRYTDVNREILWSIPSGTVLGEDKHLIKPGGFLSGKVKLRRGDRYYKDNFYIKHTHLGKKIFLFEDYAPYYENYSAFQILPFGVICDPKDTEIDAKRWYEKNK